MKRNVERKKTFSFGHYVFSLFRFCFLLFVDAQNKLQYNNNKILKKKKPFKRSSATFHSEIHAQAAKINKQQKMKSKRLRENHTNGKKSRYIQQQQQ